MLKLKNSFLFFSVLLSIALSSGACTVFQSPETKSGAPFAPPLAAPIAADDAGREGELRFLENKVRRDPEDFSANNKLAGFYLQRLRETGNAQFLDLTFRAARASLSSVPEVRNAGGLSALAGAEFASHDFSAARDHALRLIELEPRKIYPQAILGDALLELGDYSEATKVFGRMEQIGNGMTTESEIRQARLAQLRGDNPEAQKHLAAALTLTLNSSAPPRETVAWLNWQLGETAFSVGDYETSEKHYQDSLTTFPGYYRAIASLGRVRAARNDLPAAIEQYEKVVRILPDPTYVAALGDLYKLMGREDGAKTQYELVEQIGHLNALNGALYNRQLALFYADHEIKSDEAYNLAAKEYAARKDIYGADALAWTALKAGKFSEAQAAIKDALKLGTNDAKLFYHAGMIEKALSNNAQAADFLQKALKLNPMFDALQAEKARVALRELK